MPNPYMEIAERVREETNKKLEEEMARISRLTEADLSRLVPTKADKEAYAELMAIVRSRTAELEKAAALQQNIEKFGKVIVRVLNAVI